MAKNDGGPAFPTKIENAKITGTSLGPEDHGIFTAWVTVEGEGWGVGFGGYAFDSWNEKRKQRVGMSYGLEYIRRLMKTVGVERWEKLPGTYVRVETEGAGGKCLRIGHVLKDQWFDPKALAVEMGLGEEK